MPIFKTCDGFICTPDRVFHGTCSSKLDQIMASGLRPDMPKEQHSSDNCVYFAVDYLVARSIALSRASRGGDTIVLSISATDLDGEKLWLDYNMPSGRDWSMAIKYTGYILPDHLQVDRVDRATDTRTGRLVVGEPVPGQDLIAFDLGWSRAGEWLEAFNLAMPESYGW